jgi:hypothetical protein
LGISEAKIAFENGIYYAAAGINTIAAPYSPLYL